MKNKLIIGSILAVFLMVMVPSIPALEYNTVVKANEKYYINEIKHMDSEEFRDFILNLDISDEDLLNILHNKFKKPFFCKIIHKIFKFIIKLILLPIRIMLLPLTIICKIICFPFKLMCCLIKIILPGGHCGHNKKHRDD